MPLMSLDHTFVDTDLATPDEPRVYTRIEAEFREMPGLMLTLPQAARLFNLDTAQCAQVLETLVDAGLLVLHHEMYARADCGCGCA